MKTIRSSVSKRAFPETYESFIEIVHPDDRQYVYFARWKAALAGEDYDIEHRIIAGGEVRWVREKAFLEFDRNGDLLAGFGITQDITDWKNTEAELARSRKNLEIALENGNIGVWEWNLSTNEVAADERIEDVRTSARYLWRNLRCL